MLRDLWECQHVAVIADRLLEIGLLWAANSNSVSCAEFSEAWSHAQRRGRVMLSARVARQWSQTWHGAVA